MLVVLKAAQCKNTKKDEEVDGEAGREEEEEEKVIFVHYEQKKVMLSQLHPIEVPDAGTDPTSELRQVGEAEHNSAA